MNAKFVNFERGLDSKVAMGIGKRASIIKWFKDLDIVDYTIDANLNISVSGYLDLSNTNITSLPDNLSVSGDLDLENTKITSLPNNLSVSGSLNLSNTKITSLPDNLSVGGCLFLSNTKITSWPDKFKKKIIKESINFERGLDPKDAMQIGNPLLRQLMKVEIAVRKIAKKYNIPDKDIIVDENNSLVSFSNKKHTFFIGINPEFPDMEDGYPYNVGVEKLGEENNHDNYFDENCRSLSEAFTRLNFHVKAYDEKDDEITESNFERGLKPKDAMNIGLTLAKYNESQNDIDRGFELVDEYLIKVKGIKDWNTGDYKTYCLSMIKTWLNEMTPPKIIGNRIYRLLKLKGLLESNFERGLDPKKSMHIGYLQKIYDFVFIDRGYTYSQPERYMLCVCARHGKFDYVKYLVEHGFNINSNLWTTSAIEYACSNGHPEIVKYLLEKGARWPEYVKLDMDNIISSAEEINVKSDDFKEILTILKELDIIYGREDHYEKRIHESNFERGLTPKVAMGVGDVELREKKKRIEDLKWKLKFQMNPIEKKRTRAEIYKLTIETETPEEKKIRGEKQMISFNKRMAREERAWQKKEAIRKAKEKEVKKNLKTLTPRQVAINQIVDRVYWISLARSERFFDPESRRKRIQKLKKEIDVLKAQHNIKSYDLRRQTKYDPQYENENSNMKAKLIKEFMEGDYPPGAKNDPNAPYNEKKDHTHETVVNLKDGIVEIEHRHWIAEDDYDVDEKYSIDPAIMDKFLSSKTWTTPKKEMDIKDIKQIADDVWLFNTNYGEFEIRLDDLENLT